jgi:geranylgeranyl pyrophosphate synthase
LDDLLDFEAEAAFGRPSGQDLQNGVFTLPLLLALRELPDALRALLPKRNKTNREIRSIVEYVRGSGALSRTADRIRLHGEEAVRALAPLADCPEKDALVRLAETIAEQASVEARARRNADAPATTISQ